MRKYGDKSAVGVGGRANAASGAAGCAARRGRRGGVLDGGGGSPDCVAPPGRPAGSFRRRRDHAPSFAVAFEHRLPHPAQREARAPAAMQVPFEARDRRQVHRGPRVPVRRADPKSGTRPAAWSAASTAASRPMPDGISRRGDARPGTRPGPKVADALVAAVERVLHCEEARPFTGRQRRHPDPVLAGEHAAVVRLHVADDGQAAAVPVRRVLSTKATRRGRFALVGRCATNVPPSSTNSHSTAASRARHAPGA